MYLAVLCNLRGVYVLGMLGVFPAHDIVGLVSSEEMVVDLVVEINVGPDPRLRRAILVPARRNQSKA